MRPADADNRLLSSQPYLDRGDRLTISETLDRLEALYDLMAITALSGTRPDAMEIVLLRQQFVIAYLDFVRAVDADEMLAAHPRLRSSLTDALDTMRIRLMSYTMDWQPERIDADPEGYRDAAERIAKMVGSFIADTRESLTRLAAA